MSNGLRKFSRLFFLSSFVFLSTQSLINQANAGAFEIKQQSVSGAGSAHAGIAVGTDLSSMYWNPAAAANVSGSNVEQHGFGILIDSSMKSTGTPLDDQLDGAIVDAFDNVPFGDILGGFVASLVNFDGDIKSKSGRWVDDQLLASLYFNTQINDKLFVGVSLNSPLGPPSKASNHVWEGSLHARETHIFAMDLTGTLAYKVSNNLTIGGGIVTEYFKNRNELAMPTLGSKGISLNETTSVEGDNFGYGYTLGATWKPRKGTSIGLGYRSEIKHNLSGKLTAPLLTSNLALNIDAEWEMYNPAMATLSVRQDVTDRTTLLGTVHWMQWSVYDSIDIKLKPSDLVGDLAVGLIGDTVSEKLQWDDSWYFALGLEHKLNNKLTGRLGVAYELSPMQNPEQRTLRIPDADRWYFSAGGTYKYSDKIAFDFSYTYMTTEKDYEIVRKDPLFNSTFEGEGNLSYHEFGVSMKYKFGGPDHAPVKEPNLGFLK